MEAHLEIREVFAVRVDAGGRVSRLRVYGVSDRNDQRIRVDVCVANLEESGDAWVGVDQYASAMARFIDPAHGRVSWISPIARALLKAREGDIVQLKTPAGVETLEIVAVRYAAS